MVGKELPLVALAHHAPNPSQIAGYRLPSSRITFLIHDKNHTFVDNNILVNYLAG